jgi:uncharacterized protein (TIRG00374 family)
MKFVLCSAKILWSLGAGEIDLAARKKDYMRMMKNKKTFMAILRAVVVLALLVWFAVSQDLRSLAGTLSALSPAMLLAALGLFIFANSLMAMRWRFLLRFLDIRVSPAAALKVMFVGTFYNNLMLSAIGGDVLRAWYITHHTRHNKLEAAFSVIIDRLCGLAASFLLAGTGLFFSWEIISVSFGESDAGKSLNWPLVLACLAGFALLGVALLFFVCRSGKLAGLLSSVKEKLARVFQALLIYSKKPLCILLAVAVSVVVQLCTITGIFLACRSAGIDAAWRYYIAFFPICWLAASLPISPGGLGVLELGISAAFLLLPGVSPEQALTIALCQRLIFLAGSIPGLLIHLTGSHLPAVAKQPQLRK